MAEHSRAVSHKAENDTGLKLARQDAGRSVENAFNPPANHILSLQRMAGNQAVESLFRSVAIQAKLEAGRPDDIYEQEADRVAEQVMRMQDRAVQSKTLSVTPLIQRQLVTPLAAGGGYGGLMERDRKTEPGIGVPSWIQLPDYVQSELASKGLPRETFDSKSDEIRLTVLNLYVKMNGMDLWKHVARIDGGSLSAGCFHFVADVTSLKKDLSGRDNFQDPGADSDWKSAEQRVSGSLHFKQFGSLTQAHIDQIGPYTRSKGLRWLIIFTGPAHLLSYDSYKDPFMIRNLLLRQGWDPYPLLGKGFRRDMKLIRDVESLPILPKAVSDGALIDSRHMSPGINNLIGNGQPLDMATRAFLEPRFGCEFSHVRVHTDANANSLSRALGAKAFTFGRELVFGEGQYSPMTGEGIRLLAHELVHVRQQASIRNFTIQKAEIRLTVFGEAVSQLSTTESYIHGRPLDQEEKKSAHLVFGDSIDYARVRLIPTSLLEFRVVPNIIRVPFNFTIKDPEMEKTFIHEMTHVWQYQHGVTKFMAHSLNEQLVKGRNGSNFYTIIPGKSFFEYKIEQQAAIVSTYFGLFKLRQNRNIYKTFQVLHFHNSKFSEQTNKMTEKEKIDFEFALHEPLILQMRATLTLSELELLEKRATDVIISPTQGNTPADNKFIPTKPLVEVEF